MDKIIVILTLCLLSSFAVAGEVYKWKDANGIIRFSNTAPPKDAEMIGKETNYVAPAPTNQSQQSSDYDESKLSRSQKYLFMGPDRPSQQLTNEGQKIKREKTEATPYKFSWSTPSVNGQQLSLSGRVEYGESCKSLIVTAWLFDENSNRTFIECQTADVGGSASRILSGNKSIPSRWGSKWKVESTDARCSQ